MILYGNLRELSKIIIDYAFSNGSQSGYKCVLTKPRNYEFHKKYWAFCNTLGQVLDMEPESVSKRLLVESGRCDEFKLKGCDYVVLVPHSINFSNMDNEEFEKFYEDAKLHAHLLWKFDKKDLEKLIAFD
jgi:hypothetical protein